MLLVNLIPLTVLLSPCSQSVPSLVDCTSLPLNLNHELTPLFFLLTQILPGENVPLNWSLVEDDITPRGESFRNPSAKLLLQKVPRNQGASVDPTTKALHVDGAHELLPTCASACFAALTHCCFLTACAIVCPFSSQPPLLPPRPRYRLCCPP